jgi:CheY-like chemotaxis protein
MFTTKGTPVSRVLVADDDPVIRHWLTSILRSDGYDVVALSDGREVFRVLQSDANFVGAVLDLSMPNLNGPDLIRYMRTEKRLVRIPVMLITAESQINVVASGMAAGATFLLPKPFTKTRLQLTLSIMLRAKPVVRTTSLPTTTRQNAKDSAVTAVAAISPATMTLERYEDVADKPVDLGVLMSLENDDHGSSDLITELIDLYLDNAGLEIDAIKTAAVKHDARSIKQKVHSLKGSSSTIGAGRIARLCTELEETNGSSTDRTKALVTRLAGEFASVRTVLLAERQGRQGLAHHGTY